MTAADDFNVLDWKESKEMWVGKLSKLPQDNHILFVPVDVWLVLASPYCTLNNIESVPVFSVNIFYYFLYWGGEGGIYAHALGQQLE